MDRTKTPRDPELAPAARAPSPSAEGPQSTGPTNVGGQPPRGRSVSVQVPAGVERVLYLAATDPAFRARLIAERDQAALARGFALRPSERAMLRGARASQLAATIDALDVSADNVARRGFLRTVAAGAVAIAAGQTLGACDGRAAHVDSTMVMAGVDASGRDTIPADGGPEAMAGMDARPRDIPTDRAPMAGIRPRELGVPRDMRQADAAAKDSR